jgi:hypothetical protein
VNLDGKALVYFVVIVVAVLLIKSFWTVVCEKDPKFSIGQFVETKKGTVGKIVGSHEDGHYKIATRIGNEPIVIVQHFSSIQARKN